MGNGVFNIAKGREAQYASLPAASDSLIAVLLRGVEADDLLRRHDTLSAVLAANTEANFSGYSRLTLSGVSVTVDDDAGTPIATASDFTWASQARATNNTLVKLLVCYVPTSGAADTSIVPVWYWDSSLPQATVTNEPVSVTVPAEGLWRTSEPA